MRSLLINDDEVGEIEFVGGSAFFETKEGDGWFDAENSLDVNDQVAEIRVLVRRLMADLKAHALLHPMVPWV